MPTYVVTAPQGRLSQAQKNKIAADITNTHCSIASAPAYFAQVIFKDVPNGNYFVGGKPLEGTDHIFVHGQIRAGRDLETKGKLIYALMSAVAKAAELEPYCVQVYILDVPAKQIAEYGQLLPNPGEEAAWWDAVPAVLKARMEAINS